MKRVLGLSLVCVLLVLLIGCSAEAPRIGVVDVAKVIGESKGGKKANAMLDAFVKARQTVVNEKAEAIDKLRKGLAKEPAATKKAKEEELNKASVELQQLVASSQAEVKNKAAELRNSLIKEIRETVDSIGRDEKFLLILTSENAPYFQQTMDVTDRVIRKYDESNENSE